ncbi:MAG: 2-C-methyl-D-erythritol 4-phosphate cytidylyltransferase [Chloroflexota bacterium]|jgi:2-C-methyl-D-erythritol 4-phosphate cytidylyltransferase|nr:2-C-methyl-D-erythritol 4-phosphate cytidylyltransferase [Chloroflexota bacterium]
MTAAAIIVAGGEGARMQAGKNKVFLEIEGRSVLERSLSLFESTSQVSEVVLVVRAPEITRCEALKTRFRKLSRMVPGGDVRHRSEFAGIQALAGDIDAGRIDTVLVHDAVRPFASQQLVERLLAGVGQSVGCIPGLRVAPTTVLTEDGWIAGYPTNVWAVQTPQVFRATWLLEAHNRAARQGFVGTDTASVVEWAGGDVLVIEGEPNNIKITTPDDLVRAREIAAALSH